MDVAEFIRLTIDAANTDDDEQDISDEMKSRIQLIIHYGTMTMGGKIAGLTAFEPRIFRCGPPVNTVGMLHALVLAVDNIILSALSLWALRKVVAEEFGSDELKEMYEQAVLKLERCAKALLKMENLDITENVKDT